MSGRHLQGPTRVRFSASALLALMLTAVLAFVVLGAPGASAASKHGARHHAAKASKAQRAAHKRALKAAQRKRLARLQALASARKPPRPKPAPSPTPTPTPTVTSTPTPDPTTAPAPAPTPTATPAPTQGASTFGFAAGGNLHNEDATTLGKDFDMMSSASGRWVRFDINWAVVQAGGSSSYNWAPFDRIVSAAAARGMQAVGVIVYTPGWARPSGTSSTYAPNPSQYAAFAKTAASHFAALGVHTFEVWNEPNVQAFSTPSPSPSTYASILKAAYPAIKAGDPAATVLTGGTSPAATDGTNYAPVDWLRALYANGAKGSFDAVAHHPYCWPAMPGDAQGWSAWYQMYGTNPSLRSTMADNGDGDKKIWATEFGAPTNGPSGSYVSESTQASMVTKGYQLWQTYSWAGPMMWYAGRDAGTTTDTRENFFGLVRSDFSPKPAFTAYKNAAVAAGT